MTATLESTTETVAGHSPLRDVALDAARGLAIALMVLDHVLLLTDADSIIRETLTRASLPLFMLILGHLWKPRRPWGKIALYGCVASVFGVQLGIGQPDVLVLIAFAMLTLNLAHRIGLDRRILLVLCMVQVISWQLPITGYQPGTVLGLAIVGTYSPDLPRALKAMRHVPELAAIGRHPLAWYMGHVFFLFALGRVA